MCQVLSLSFSASRGCIWSGGEHIGDHLVLEKTDPEELPPAHAKVPNKDVPPKESQ